MAKPDTDQGWLKYAHELDAALAVSDFNKYARVILHEVLSQVFGPSKSKSALVSASDLARRTGLLRPHLSRAFGELAAAGALTRLPDGSWRFNKDYEAWTRKGAPRLTPVEVAYCRSAPARAMRNGVSDARKSRTKIGTPAAPKTPRKSVPKLVHPVPKLVQGETPSCTKIGTAPVPKLVHPPAADNTNARGIEFKNEFKKKRREEGNGAPPHHATSGGAPTGPPPPEAAPVPVPEAAPPPAPAPARKAEVIPAVSGEYGDPKYEPAYQPDDDLLYPIGGTHDLTDAEARAIWTKVWRLTGQARACTEFVQKRRHHSAAVWLQAIEELRQRGTAIRGFYIIDLRAGDIEVRPAEEPVRRNGRPAPPRATTAADVYVAPGSIEAELRANMQRDLERESGPRKDAPR